MSQSKYTFKKEIFNNNECIFIEDQHQDGYKTVTNNIVEVMKEIEASGLNPKHHIIVIQTKGIWDGYDARLDKFELLDATNPYHAVNRWLKRVKEAAANGNQ